MVSVSFGARVRISDTAMVDVRVMVRVNYFLGVRFLSG